MEIKPLFSRLTEKKKLKQRRMIVNLHSEEIWRSDSVKKTKKIPNLAQKSVQK